MTFFLDSAGALIPKGQAYRAADALARRCLKPRWLVEAPDGPLDDLAIAAVAVMGLGDVIQLFDSLDAPVFEAALSLIPLWDGEWTDLVAKAVALSPGEREVLAALGQSWSGSLDDLLESARTLTVPPA